MSDIGETETKLIEDCDQLVKHISRTRINIRDYYHDYKVLTKLDNKDIVPSSVIKALITVMQNANVVFITYDDKAVYDFIQTKLGEMQKAKLTKGRK